MMINYKNKFFKKFIKDEILLELQSMIEVKFIRYGDNLPCYKVIFVGPTNTGKTTILKKITGSDSFGPTLGLQIVSVCINKTKFNIWDCGGLHRGAGKKYYQNTDIAFVFSNNNQSDMDLYLKEVKEVNPKLLIILTPDVTSDQIYQFLVNF